MRALLVSLALAIAVPGLSQNDSEALRYSMRDVTGSARFMGVGGAFTALGGDFTVTSYNPGGLGLYRRSEVYLGTQFISTNTDARYYGDYDRASRFNFNFSGAGAVFNSYPKNNSQREEKKGWLYTSFAIGMNRLANYSSRVQFSGFNPNNSFLHSYLEEANANGGTSPTQISDQYPFGAGLAYEAYLIDPSQDDSNMYVSKVPNGKVQQSKDIWSRGALDEYVISFAANYSNKWYLGATLGIPVLKYYEQSTYEEEDVDDVISDFDNYRLTEDLITRGTGINLKVGFITWITENIRIGGAVHTPTPIFMNDRYIADISSDVEAPENYFYESPIGEFKYRLITPFRFMGGLALVFAPGFLISADYEYVNYAQARFSFRGVEFDDFQDALNTAIKDKYGSSHTLRVGSEVVLDAFRLRGGLNFNTSALKNEVAVGDLDYSGSGWALGFGYRGESFFADATFTRNSRSQAYYPYTLSDPDALVNGASLQQEDIGLTLTAGFRF